MKKMIRKTMVIVLAVSVLLCGCSSGSSDDKDTSGKNTDPVKTESATNTQLPAKPEATKEAPTTKPEATENAPTTKPEATEKVTPSDTQPAEETATPAPTEPAVEPLQLFEFNPHVYSPHLAKSVAQDYWDSLYNLCDALREGKTSFKCSSQKAYDWCTDITVLCDLFPAAALRIEAKSEDGSPAFKDGIGKIRYKVPVGDFLKRQSDFEEMIEEIINSNVEYDDTDYEKALKLYLYMARNYDYDHNPDSNDASDNYVMKTFIRKTGKCINFAAVYSYLLLQVGVDSLSIGCSETMDHEWAYVTINGKGYHIDPTWALHSSWEDLKGDEVYLDYFMMDDENRNDDGLHVDDLMVDILPEYWANRVSVSYAATDDHYNIRYYYIFDSLDEENKILKYTDNEGNIYEFKYDI